MKEPQKQLRICKPRRHASWLEVTILHRDDPDLLERLCTRNVEGRAGSWGEEPF